MRWTCLIAPVLLVNIAHSAQEDGKALVQRVCTKCHALNTTTGQRNSPARWSDVVDDMVARGAEASDAEIVKMIDYLSTNFGPRLKVNAAGADEIAAALGIPKSVADEVVAYRLKNGVFHSLQDLMKVPGLDAADVERKKDSLDFSAPK